MKEGTRANMHPQLSVKGIGYDRLLGGFEIDTRLQKHLAKVFEVSCGVARGDSYVREGRRREKGCLCEGGEGEREGMSM